MISRICHLLKMQQPEMTRGLLFSSGATVPSDGADGYQMGCIFLHTDGAVGTAFYVNEGSVTSCDFNPVLLDGPMFASGTTVPSDGATGYGTGCIFQKTDGGAGTALYINEGNTTSADFNALTGGAGGTTLGGLTDTGTIAYTAGSIIVGDGDSYEEVAISGDATLAANGALTISANAIETGMIAADAVRTADIQDGAVTAAKVEGLAAGQFLVGVDGTAANNAKVIMSGDATLSASGVLTISAGSVEDSMIEALNAGQFIIGTDGTAAGNTKVTVSGPFNLSATGLLSLDSATAAAAGSNQGDAVALADGYSLVTAADGTKGAKLPAAAAGGLCLVKNNASAALKLYPNTDDKIDDGSANAAITVSAERAVLLVAYDATDWYTVGSAGDALADLYDVGATAYTAGSLLVGSGTAYAEVALSGPFSLSSAGLLSMDSATVAATGSNQGDAAAVADGFTLVTAADGTKGVKLPVAAAGGLCVLKNNAANLLKVYPNTDDKIDDGSANAAITVSAERAVVLVAYDATDWYSVGDASLSLADLYDVGATAYTAGKILVASGTAYAEVAVSGDVTLASNGAVTIAEGAVEDSMIEGLADGQFIIGVDGTAANNAKVTMSGHATLANDGSLTLATATKTCAISLTSLKKSAAGKDALPDAPDATDLGLADGIGSPVVGTTTNNNAATEKCAFDFVVPADYSDGDLTVRVKFLFSAARNSESLLDVVVKHIKSGALDATDLCLTSAIDVKSVTAEANQDFTIDHDASGDEIAAGSVLHVEISCESDDTGGGSDGYAQINGIDVLVPCYR